MNLKQQLEAALKAAREIAEKAKNEQRDLTEQEQSDLDGKLGEVDDLKAKIASAAKSDEIMAKIAALGPTDDSNTEPASGAAKSLGEHFVKHAGERLKENRGVPGASAGAPEFIKASSDTQERPSSAADWATTFQPGIVAQYRRPLVIADLLSQGTLSGHSISYLVEGDLEGDAATVKEAGSKSQIHYADPTQVTESLTKIAAFLKFTDEMIEDFAFLVSNINNRGLYELGLKEESQILTGNGTAPNLKGLLNRTGVQTESATTDVSGADNPDAIFRAMMKVQNETGFAADGIVIHPTDYQKLRLMKDSNNQYFGGGFFSGEYGQGGVAMQPPLWGTRTVVTSATDSGTVVVGAFKQAATLYRKGGVRVESTNSHSTDFTSNLVTTRIEERVALAVPFPKAICKVTLNYDEPSGT